MFRKRGLAGVVTTLIIILLVLVAIGVIWVVIKNLVQKGSEKVELGQFTLDLQIKKAQVENGNVTVVVVRRNPGEGNFVGMNFIFSDGQNSEIIRQNATLQELEEKTFIFTLTKINTSSLKTISVAPIYELISGKETVGNIADSFDVSKSGTGTGSVAEGNFVKYGPVGAGLTDYSVDSASGVLPKFTRVIIDPLDVHIGDNQTFTAYVSSSYNITEVTTETQLDNEILTLPLIEVSPGVYSATWQVYDTHSQVYRTNFTAKDSGGNENTIAMSWTDPCTGFSHGTTSTVTSACTISTIDGVDAGNIVVATGGSITVNNGAFLVYTPGFSIGKSGSGSISLAGTLTKQYLYYYDSDADNRSVNGTYLFNISSTWSGKTRPKNVLSTSDCNDASASAWVNRYADGDGDSYGAGSLVCVGNNAGYVDNNNDCSDSSANIFQNIGSLVQDVDQDGYTTGSAGTQCVGSSITISSRTYYQDSGGSYTWVSGSLGTDCNDASASAWRNRYADGDGDTYGGLNFVCVGNDAGYVDNTDDCYDFNSDAKPGQTNYFTTGRGDASFDYNCVNGEEKQYTAIGTKRVCAFSGSCSQTTAGVGGYETSVPVCGSSGTYYLSFGLTCGNRLEAECVSDDTISEARAQPCH